MKLGLGTVQFGMKYGVSNSQGPCSKEEMRKILETAKENGITFLDTAPNYGDSEALLGELCSKDNFFNIITKIPALYRNLSSGTLINHLQNSLKKLQSNAIYGLLLHHVDDLLGPDGKQIWDEMQELKALGLVKKIGASVYTGQQIEQLMDLYAIDLIQLPINIFDQRLLHNGVLRNLKKSNVEIHARSIFMQGLLLMEAPDIPDFFSPIKANIEQYYHWVLDNKMTKLEAALCFITSIKEIDLALVGVNSLEHLQALLSSSQLAKDLAMFSDLAIQDDQMLNPSHWCVTQQ